MAGWRREGYKPAHIVLETQPPEDIGETEKNGAVISSGAGAGGAVFFDEAEALEITAKEDSSYARIEDVVKLAAALARTGVHNAITPEDVGEVLRMERQKTA